MLKHSNFCSSIFLNSGRLVFQHCSTDTFTEVRNVRTFSTTGHDRRPKSHLPIPRNVARYAPTPLRRCHCFAGLKMNEIKPSVGNSSLLLLQQNSTDCIVPVGIECHCMSSLHTAVLHKTHETSSRCSLSLLRFPGETSARRQSPDPYSVSV